jgi:hypothetical protein
MGLKPDPNGIWREQVARNATDFEEGTLEGKKYLKGRIYLTGSLSSNTR